MAKFRGALVQNNVLYVSCISRASQVEQNGQYGLQTLSRAGRSYFNRFQIENMQLPVLALLPWFIAVRDRDTSFLYDQTAV